MKKLIAILFVFLFCLTNVPGNAYVWDTGYELLTGCEEPETKNKEGKKEIKEFTVHAFKKPYAAPSLSYRYKLHPAFIYPRPVLNLHTPPPDVTC